MRAAVQLLILTTLNRTGGEQLASQFVLALAVSAPVFVGLEMGLRTLYVTLDTRIEFSRYLVLRCAALVVAAAVVVLAASVILPGLSWGVLVLVISAKTIDSLADLFCAPLQAASRIVQMSVVICSNAVATGILVLAVAGATGSGVAVLLASIIGSTVGLAVALQLQRKARHIYPNCDRVAAPARLIVRPGVMLGISTCLASLLMMFPALALGRWGTPEEILLFALAQYVLLAIEMLLNAHFHSALPSLVAIRQIQGTPALRNRTFFDASRFAAFLVPASPIGMILIVAVWNVASNAQTMALPTSLVLAVVAASAILPLSFGGVIALEAANRFGSQALTVSVAAGVCIAIAIAIVPRLQSTGAVLAIAGAAGVRAAGSYWFCGRSAGGGFDPPRDSER